MQKKNCVIELISLSFLCKESFKFGTVHSKCYGVLDMEKQKRSYQQTIGPGQTAGMSRLA
jgi:hypothetical protein